MNRHEGSPIKFGQTRESIKNTIVQMIGMYPVNNSPTYYEYKEYIGVQVWQ